MSKLIQRALRSADETKLAVVAVDALDGVPACFRELFGDATAVVIGDERTMTVAGQRVHDSLVAAGIPTIEPYVFPGDPELYASYENCQVIRDFLAPLDVRAVAVGAGTLNDIVKRGCGELGRPYLQVGTAASMDGYTAFGASITRDGFKITHDCPAPAGSISDIAIMAAAPQVMTASGYGDLIGKLPAGADWLLADAVGVEPVDPTVWELVQGPLRGALARPQALAAGDVAATGELAEGLIMSGLAMQAHQSSRPASGGEHQFSHLWEMEGLGMDVRPRRLSHGFKVGIGTICTSALFERLFLRDVAALDVATAVAAWPTREELEADVRSRNPNPGFIENIVEQQLGKWITREQLAERIERLQRAWPELLPRLRANVLSPADTQARLAAVGAPTHPADIGLSWERFRQSFFRAGMIRRRYTIHDTLFELGIQAEIVEEIFSPAGFWGRQER